MSSINKLSTTNSTYDSLYDSITSYYFAELPTEFEHFCVYSADGSETMANLSERDGSKILGETVVSNITDFIEHLKSEYNIKNLWFSMFPPNTGIQTFCVNTPNTRFFVPLSENSRFFTYEMSNNHDAMELMSTQFANKTSITDFNVSFMETEGNVIHTLETKSVYNLGLTGHLFHNDSNDKLAFAIEFELLV